MCQGATKKRCSVPLFSLQHIFLSEDSVACGEIVRKKDGENPSAVCRDALAVFRKCD